MNRTVLYVQVELQTVYLEPAAMTSWKIWLDKKWKSWQTQQIYLDFVATKKIFINLEDVLNQHVLKSDFVEL